MERNKNTPVLDWFKSIANELINPEIKKFKENGGKVIGMFYPDTPIELLEAMGCMGFSLRGNTADGTELADAYFKPLTCEFTRATFNEILERKYSFLDGAVWFNNCDHMRRIYDNWKACDPKSPAYSLIYFPKHRDERAFEYFKEQVHEMIKASEKRFNTVLDPEALRKVIVESNKTRSLIRHLYDLRKGEEILIDGSEVAAVLLAVNSLPRSVVNQKLSELISELTENPEGVKPRCRILYSGFHADRPDILDLIEQQGVYVVCDTIGSGLSSAEVEIKEEGDPIENVLRYYFFEKVPQPRIWGTEGHRMERLVRLVKDFKCDGVVATRIAFCDQQAFEQFMMLGTTKKNNIPYLQLETTYDPEGVGQIRTRIQAFLESIDSLKADRI